jgi:exonuclease SbcC
MLPLKLTLHNFMCYRDNVPPLDFRGIHTACISGDNGSGKSALIDAMTWALWGKTRAKSVDDLIHAGQPEMTVELEFAVSGQIYRVMRKRARPRSSSGAGQSLLELSLVKDIGLATLTGNTIEETEKKIISLLHMDYDTFINSAFLRQGHADEFTVKRPGERKQVLAEILGFGIYDRLEERAKELARREEDEAARLENQTHALEEQLTHKAEWEADLLAAQDRLSEVMRLMNAQEAQRNRLRQDRDRLEHQKQQLDELSKHMAQRRREMERWQEQARLHQEHVVAYEVLLRQKAAIEENLEQLLSVRREDAVHNETLRRLNTLALEEKHLLGRINQARQELVASEARFKADLGNLETRAMRLAALETEIAQLQLEELTLARREAGQAQKRQTAQGIGARIAELAASVTSVESALNEVNARLHLLLSQGDTRCPLCERELGTESSLHLKTKLETEKRQRTEQLAAFRTEAAAHKAALEALSKEIITLEVQLKRDQSTLHNRLGQKAQARADAAEASGRLPEARLMLSEIQTRLEKQRFAPTEQVRLNALSKERQALNYNADAHEAIRERVNQLSPAEAAHQKLTQAEKLLTAERGEVNRAQKYATEVTQTLAGDNEIKQALEQELAALGQVTTDLNQAEQGYQSHLLRQKEAQEKLGSLKERLAQCSEIEARRTNLRQLRDQAAAEHGTYKELAQAFGRNGIQAMLIDLALPEIEAEADKLLSRMTDNRMHLRMETQRPTRKGELTETLDIKISDELGTRNYELFSGGEAFRINFAIRIALSRLLARRAGAPLPTLIIDEGFGTQDSNGIEKLREAITSIQEDFERILVITHIEELKDAFPTRIDVIKSGDGSTIEIH